MLTVNKGFLPILVLLQGCATVVPVCEPIGKPVDGELIGINQVQWETLSPDVQDTISHDYLEYQKRVKLRDALIEAHDEVCQ